jgi:Tetratricopeptide repeat
MRVGLYVHGRGAYLQAAPFYERALAIREETLGSEHPDTVTSLGSRASLVTDLGEHPDTRRALIMLLFFFRTRAILQERDCSWSVP